MVRRRLCDRTYLGRARIPELLPSSLVLLRSPMVFVGTSFHFRARSSGGVLRAKTSRYFHPGPRRYHSRPYHVSSILFQRALNGYHQPANGKDSATTFWMGSGAPRRVQPTCSHTQNLVRPSRSCLSTKNIPFQFRPAPPEFPKSVGDGGPGLHRHRRTVLGHRLFSRSGWGTRLEGKTLIFNLQSADPSAYVRLLSLVRR